MFEILSRRPSIHMTTQSSHCQHQVRYRRTQHDTTTHTKRKKRNESMSHTSSKIGRSYSEVDPAGRPEARGRERGREQSRFPMQLLLPLPFPLHWSTALRRRAEALLVPRDQEPLGNADLSLQQKMVRKRRPVTFSAYPTTT